MQQNSRKERKRHLSRRVAFAAFFAFVATGGSLSRPLHAQATDDQAKQKAAPAHSDSKPEQKDRTLLVAQVVDADTNKPISKFIALAGVNPLEGLGWQWQPHTAHEFSDGKLEWPPHGSAGYSEQVIRIEAEGYLPYQSPLLVNTANHEDRGFGHARAKFVTETISAEPGLPAKLEIRLEPDPGIEGVVLSPTGLPVADVDLAIAMANDQIVHLDKGKISFAKRQPGFVWPTYRQTKSDKDGHFKLPSEIQTAAVVAVHPFGVAVLDYRQVAANKEVKLQPWGRIEGDVQWGKAPGRAEKVSLIAHGCKGTKDFQPMFMFAAFQDATSDQEGRFVFDFVPPGPVQLNCGEPVQFAEVASGVPTKVVFGGRGRPVTGKLTGRSTWDDVRIRIAPTAPRPGDMGTQYDPWPAYQNFLASPAGANYVKSNVRVKADGSFVIENVLPERYQLFVTAPTNGKNQNIGYATLYVETIPDGKTDETQSVGEIKTEPRDK